MVGLLVVMALAWAGTQALSHWQAQDSARLVRSLAKDGDIVEILPGLAVRANGQ